MNSALRSLAVLMVFVSACLAGGNGPAAPAARAAESANQSALQRLLWAYPGLVSRASDAALQFGDGSTLPLDDGRGEKSFDEWLAHPDIEDMFRIPYPAGAPITAPAENSDPGRARNEAFFKKIYGDCRKGEVVKNLVEITWLPKKSGTRLKVTRINGVAEKLQAVSDALDKLPARFDVFLTPPAGTYNCRAVAGTAQLSAHGYGIAIDIATPRAHYWRWTGKPGSTITYKNDIPPEIVAIFEQHGFIWGGRWHHYDTMHFEYRLEMFSGGAGGGARPLP